jgi:hypothetical protein
VTLARFERFIGIDWSGAKDCSNRSIQVAEFLRGARHPELIEPRDGKYWSRSAVERYLKTLTDRRTLVGIDFAFSVPTPFPVATLEVRELWAFVDDFCLSAQEQFSDHYAGAVWLADTSPFRPHFRYDEYRGPLFDGKKLRQTEKISKPRASSVYKLMYSQVGRGSFAGMRVLRSLSPRSGGEIAIWPFDQIGASPVVVVEVYPSALYPLANCTRPNPEKQTPEEVTNVVDKVLRRFDATCSNNRPKLQDAIDAYITSAALAHLSKDATKFAIPTYLQSLAKQEGWIFGVPFENAS